MEFFVTLALPVAAAGFWAWLSTLNRVRRDGVAWGDAFLQAGTRGVIWCAKAAAIEIGLIAVACAVVALMNALSK